MDVTAVMARGYRLYRSRPTVAVTPLRCVIVTYLSIVAARLECGCGRMERDVPSAYRLTRLERLLAGLRTMARQGSPTASGIFRKRG
jgi:hypothetical protein